MAFTGTHGATQNAQRVMVPHQQEGICAFRDSLRKRLVARKITIEDALSETRERGRDADTIELIGALDGILKRSNHPRFVHEGHVRETVINRALRRHDRRVLSWDEISRL